MRIYSLDAFRLIASFFVVSLHVNLPVESLSALSIMCRIAVPFFFMVSGYFYNEEKTISTIKKLLKYTLIAIGVYFLVELFMHSSWDFAKEELSYLKDYRFWIANVVPFCHVAWYLIALIYMMLLSRAIRSFKFHCVLGVLSFVFATVSGVYSEVFGIEGIDSLMWNCCFMSTYCWFVLGRFLKKNNIRHSSSTCLAGGGYFADTYLIFFIVISIISMFVEHYLIKINTTQRVSGTTYVSSLPALIALFILLLRHPNWGKSLTIGNLPLIIYLSHVAIYYFLCTLFWPSKFELSETPIFQVSHPNYLINNISVFLIASGIGIVIETAINYIKKITVR